MLRAIFAGLACVGMAGQAAAQNAPAWMLTVSGSSSQGDDDLSSSSASVGLERQAGSYWFGGAIGSYDGERTTPELGAAVEQDGVLGSLWWGAAAGDYDFTVSLDLADGDVGAEDVTLRSGAVVDVTGEITSSRIGATLARSYGELSTITPSVTLSYDQTEADLDVVGAGGASVRSSTDASGFTGAIALDGALAIAESASLLGGAALLATDDAAAQGFAFSGPRARAGERQSEGAAQWGEAYLGLEFMLGEAATLSATAGSTLGRDEDEAFGAVSVGWSF